MRASSMACERLELFHAVLRSSLDARTEALVTGGRNGNFGCTGDSWRWGEVCVAPQADWKRPVGFWILGECFWKVKLGRGGLVQEFAGMWIFGQEEGTTVCGVGFEVW